MKYKVCFWEDGIYEVVEISTHETKFKGSLSDCEAWIRLTNKGYL